jgi:arylsulfatase A-like enzyme
MATDKPNILLIVADDLGNDTFRIDDTTNVATIQVTGVTGSYALPNISRLVREGVHFTRAWAHPICAPTRATLFTGMHPWRTTIGDAAGNPFLPRTLPSDGTTDLKTLAHMVTDAGYQCAIFGKWDLGEDPATGVPTARGWHRHEGILAGGLRFIPEDPPNKTLYEQIIQQDVRYVSWNKVICDATLDNLVRENITPEERTHKYATADEIYSARDWIKQMEGRPWWVTLSVLAPHDPFHVPPQGTYTIRFDDPANPTDQEMFVAMMESLDHYLGELFDDPSPEIQNQLQETVIIFVGDNGTDDQLDGISGDDKSSVGIGGVHVPMIIADGGLLFGEEPCYLDTKQIDSEKAELVHIADVFQTIIDIAGGSASPGYTTDSISMVPYLKNTAGDARFTGWQGRKYTFGQFFVPDDIPGLAGRYQQLGEQATISDGQYKLNYKNGTYEFLELTFDPATDITSEKEVNDFQHPRAIELWKQLTTPGKPNYAEVTGKGKKFPPLPQVPPTNVYRYIRFVALSGHDNVPWVTVADFTLLDANQNPIANRSGWTATASSEDKGSFFNATNIAANAIDGNTQTYWRSRISYMGMHPKFPHELHIDMGAPQQITGFNYLPAQDETRHIKDYRLFASTDNVTWVLLAEGTFPNTIQSQTVIFGTTTGTGGGTDPSLPAPMQERDTFILHLNADTAPVANPGGLQTWPDSSGANNHATAVPNYSGVQQEHITNNGKNIAVMRFFDTSGMILPDTLHLADNDAFTIIVVNRYYVNRYADMRGATLESRDKNWVVGLLRAQHVCIMGNKVHNQIRFFNRTADAVYVAQPQVFSISTAIRHSSSAATWHLNGVLCGQANGTIAPGRLGLVNGGANPMGGNLDIATVLIWKRALSDTERKQVEQWLADKYSLSMTPIPQGTPSDAFRLENAFQQG